MNVLPILLSWLLAGGLAQGGRPGPPAAAPPLVRVAAAADLKFALDATGARLARGRRPLRVEATYG